MSKKIYLKMKRSTKVVENWVQNGNKYYRNGLKMNSRKYKKIFIRDKLENMVIPVI